MSEPGKNSVLTEQLVLLGVDEHTRIHVWGQEIIR